MAAITPDDLNRLISDHLDRQEQKYSDLEAQAARNEYATRRMGDIPLTYRNLMPATTNQKLLSASEQAIRAKFRDDFHPMISTAAALGHLPSNLYEPDAIAKAAAQASAPRDAKQEGWIATATRANNGENVAPRPASPTATDRPIDASGMSGVQMIAHALRGEADPRAAYK